MIDYVQAKYYTNNPIRVNDNSNKVSWKYLTIKLTLPV